MSEAVAKKWLGEGVIEKLSRLEFVARGTVEGFVAGKHRSARKGASVEFAEHRQYVPGDDLRNLDWKLMARRQRFYVKQYVDETNLRATIALDCSGSMTYCGQAAFDSLSKFDYGRHLAAALAYLLVSQQDAAGFVAFDSAVRTYMPAKASPAQVGNILDAIDTIKPGGETETAAVLHEIAERIPRRSVVFVISDFFADASALIKAFHHLRFRHHEVIAIRTVAAEESTFPFGQHSRFEDLESALMFDVDARALRNDYLEHYRRHEAELKRACGEMRIAFETAQTSVPFDQALADMLIGYHQRGGRR